VTVVTDDRGDPVALGPAPAGRVVSLVPSLTEAVAATRRDALVGCTQWCTHPGDLAVERVRGTKNPDVRRIVSLAPDLVIANQEENRRVDVERLRAAGVPVWVTVVEDVIDALDSLRRLFAVALRWPVPSWLDEADAAWRGPVPPPRARVAIAVWRDPWMVVGRNTFAGDLARRLGLANVFAEASERYPRVTVAEIEARSPEVVLLPDEPYRFTAEDGPEAFTAPCALVSGRLLTWYGPSLIEAPTALTAAVSAAAGS